MFRLWRKAAAAALAAVFISGLAAGPAAASEPSVQIQVCNASSYRQLTWITGLNQNGDKVRWGPVTLQHESCIVTENYWWKTDQSVVVEHAIPSVYFFTTSYPIASWAHDGSTVQMSYH
jgi:hypothetical protein